MHRDKQSISCGFLKITRMHPARKIYMSFYHCKTSVWQNIVYDGLLVRAIGIFLVKKAVGAWKAGWKVLDHSKCPHLRWHSHLGLRSKLYMKPKSTEKSNFSCFANFRKFTDCIKFGNFSKSSKSRAENALETHLICSCSKCALNNSKKKTAAFSF